MKKFIGLLLVLSLLWGVASCSNVLTGSAEEGVSLDQASEVSSYYWSRTLRQGSRGADVKELQIRVAGWASDYQSKTYVSADGIFGSGTTAAVKRFQRAYGLGADGIVGPQTQARLNALESWDKSTIHFAWSEFYSKDGSGFSGGKVSSTTIKENVRRNMWKLEALRKKSGNRSISVTSGFRSINHNRNVGGASNSQHLYGIASDIKVSSRSVSSVMGYAKTSGYSGIIRYNTFTHVDSRLEYPYGAQRWYWTN